MWITELATNTSTADNRMGSSRLVNATDMETSSAQARTGRARGQASGGQSARAGAFRRGGPLDWAARVAPALGVTDSGAGAGAPQLVALRLVERAAELQQRREQVVALEVVLAAAEVHRAAGREAAVLEVAEPDAPGAAGDRLLAVPARGACARRALGAVDARQPAVGGAELGAVFELRAVGNVRRRRRERFQQRGRPLARRAQQMEPQRHLAVGERIRQPFAEPQLALRDRSRAAAAPAAAARRRLEDMR